MKSKVSKLFLNGNGSYLGIEKGCFTVKDKNGNIANYPLFENEIGEVLLKSGNSVSTGALASMGFWGIDALITTQKGKPVAMLRSLDDDSHVKTRVCQYEALKDSRAFEIARQFVKSKIEGQNIVLKKYDLNTDTAFKLRVDTFETFDLGAFRRKVMMIEAKFSEFYFKQLFQLIPESIRPESRKTFKAYDGVNNLFNLGYELLAWKVHRALINAKLEPYLGFLHSEQFGKPSLVCDFQELYRYLIDDFIIQYCKSLTKRDFTFKSEKMSANKKGKREYLKDVETKDFSAKLSQYFETYVKIPRIKVGERQTIETLINEETMLFAKYLRNEKKEWIPRTSNLTKF
jgi:CRISP-associated protein Cas1